MDSKKTKRLKQRIEIKIKTSLRRVTWIASALVGILAIGLTLFFNFSANEKTYAVVSGEYRTKASGNWNSAATWQKYNGSTWANATLAPTSADQTITILSGHTVTITANITADQIVVSSGGTLIQNSSVTLTVNNGTGTDLSVSGTYKNAGTVTINASAAIAVLNGGKYQHNFTTTAGVIPTATWSAGSICEIIGYTTNTSAPTGLQAFSNFVWNCPSQTNWVNLNSGLTSITQNFTITSTGSSGGLRLANSSASTLTVSGNFTLTSGNFSLSDGGNITSTLNVAADYTQTAGTFSIVDGSASTGNVNVSGNWTHTSGTLTVGGNASTSSTITFNKSGSQSFTNTTPIVSGNVDFVINSGSTLLMGASSMIGRNFTLSSGGGISIGSLSGITASSSTGNIQVTGSRSYSTTADYAYTGGASQVFGDGLPTTLRNLTINSGGIFTMDSDYTVSGILTLTNGKIYTSTYTLNVTNTSTGSIAGYSSSNFIIGNLNRSVSGSGAYDYPLGSLVKYELLTVTLSGTTGFTRLAGSFIATNPNDTVYPLNSIIVSGVDMSELLDYGYWSLSSNSPITGGSYTIRIKEQGYSNTLLPSTLYSVLMRNDLNSSWTSVGTHADNTQSLSAGIVTAERADLTSFGLYSIALGDIVSFSNPTLRSGTAGAIGAIYVFPDVLRLVDAWVEIINISGGAVLNNIDDNSKGYNMSFQPFVDQAANATSYIEWRITFKKSATSTDTTLKKLTATGIDVDGGDNGGGKMINEFIEATMPTSYNLDPVTTLTVTNLSGNYRVSGFQANISNIDTSQKQGMYELNYNNVNSIMFKTGSVSTLTSSQVRHTSLFFKAFNLANSNIALPIKLIYFKTQLKNNVVNLSWATAAEVNNDFFTVERSSDGQNFEPILTKRGAGNSTITLEYGDLDPNPLEGYSYYRLKQTDYDGHFSYSDVQTIKNKGGNNIDEAAVEITTISPNPFSDEFKIDFILKQKSEVEIMMIGSKGELIFRETILAEDGYNSYTYTDSKGIPSGYYFVTITYKDQKVTRKIMKL